MAFFFGSAPGRVRDHMRSFPNQAGMAGQSSMFLGALACIAEVIPYRCKATANIRNASSGLGAWMPWWESSRAFRLHQSFIRRTGNWTLGVTTPNRDDYRWLTGISTSHTGVGNTTIGIAPIMNESNGRHRHYLSRMSVYKEHCQLRESCILPSAGPGVQHLSIRQSKYGVSILNNVVPVGERV